MPGMNAAGHGTPVLDTLGALFLLVWALAMWAAVAALAAAGRRSAKPWVYRATLAVIGIGVLGQIGHLQEHVAQAGYWLAHPNAPAWMTPWGTGLARGFGQVDTTKPNLGMEILHLTGNFIFLAGLAAVMVITRGAPGTRTRRWARMGVWMQGIHGLEHLSLTLSVAFGAKRAIGLSTWFGLVSPGPGLTTYRIWWHFLANVIGSIIFAVALWHLQGEREQIRAGFRLAEPTPGRAGQPGPAAARAT